MPTEKLGHGRITVESVIIEKILEGATNAQILLSFPHYLRGMREVEHARQTLKRDEYRDLWRNLEVTYIWGAKCSLLELLTHARGDYYQCAVLFRTRS